MYVCMCMFVYVNKYNDVSKHTWKDRKKTNTKQCIRQHTKIAINIIKSNQIVLTTDTNVAAFNESGPSVVPPEANE